MFDVVFSDSVLLKKIFNAFNDVLKEVTLDCSAEAIKVMGMDASHVALVELFINADSEGPIFTQYRCDKTMSLTFKVDVMQKILKSVHNDDSVQFLVEDEARVCKFTCSNKALNRMSTFEVCMIEKDDESLGTPDAEYQCEVQMPSMEFAKTMRDLSLHGESLNLRVDKERLAFGVKGEESSMQVELKERRPRKDREEEERLRLEEERKEVGDKPEGEETAETTDETPAVDDEAAAEEDDVDMEGESLAAISNDKKAKKKLKKAVEPKETEDSAKEGEDPNLTRVAFKVAEPVETMYSLRYMNMFAKAAPLSNYVKMSVSSEQPIIVKFPLGDEERGHLSFYLAPKIDD